MILFLTGSLYTSFIYSSSEVASMVHRHIDMSTSLYFLITI